MLLSQHGSLDDAERSLLVLSVIAFYALDVGRSGPPLRTAYSHRVQESPLTGGASRKVCRAAIRLPG